MITDGCDENYAKVTDDGSLNVSLSPEQLSELAKQVANQQQLQIKGDDMADPDQRQQPGGLASVLGGSAGSALGSITAGSITSGSSDVAWTTTTTDGTGAFQYNLQDAVDRAVEPVRKLIKFFRVNQVVEIANEAILKEEFADPIDELRLKVARWLNPKEEYNFVGEMK